jgi:hypothetical protein
MGAAPGLSQGRSQYDVVGASEGPDIGSLAPDSQSFLIRALAAHLDKITQLLKPDPSAPIEQVQFEVDAFNIPGGGLQYHLPNGGNVVGYYLENNSNNTISIYAGASGASRALATAPANTFKSSPIPQQIESVAIVSSGSATGLVRLLISSVNLGPAFGSLLGSAAAPPSNTATTTTPTATTTPAQILAANPARVGASILNTSGSIILSLGFGAGVLMQTVAANANGVLPVNWKGSVWAFTPSTTAPLVVTEYT